MSDPHSPKFIIALCEAATIKPGAPHHNITTTLTTVRTILNVCIALSIEHIIKLSLCSYFIPLVGSEMSVLI